MAVLSVQTIPVSGLAASMTSASAGGDKFDNANDGRTFLRVKNGGGASINVTIAKQAASVNVGGFGALAVADEVIAVAAGAEKDIGPFPAGRFNDANGQVNVSYSGVTTVTVAALRLAQLVA
jgi:hypothetical protein